MIEVTLVTNDGAGTPKKYEIREGTTLATFLKMFSDVDTEEFTIRVRSNGESVTMNSEDGDNYTLQDGDRVSLASQKVEGAK